VLCYNGFEPDPDDQSENPFDDELMQTLYATELEVIREDSIIDEDGFWEKQFGPYENDVFNLSRGRATDKEIEPYFTNTDYALDNWVDLPGVENHEIVEDYWMTLFPGEESAITQPPKTGSHHKWSPQGLPLRFEWSEYHERRSAQQGPHPNTRVTLIVPIDSLGLETELARQRLIRIAGPDRIVNGGARAKKGDFRLTAGELKLSAKLYGTIEENKMHLKELLSELVREANQPGPVHKSLHKPREQNAKASA